MITSIVFTVQVLTVVVEPLLFSFPHQGQLPPGGSQVKPESTERGSRRMGQRYRECLCSRTGCMDSEGSLREL